jgi:predicted transcriptional regulator of viral defense system
MLARSTSTSSWFFARHPVFTTDEFSAFHKLTKRESRYALLAYNRRSGRVLNIRRGIYAAVPDGVEPQSYMVNPFLVTAKATSDAVVAYHSALSFHGHAYSDFNVFTYLTKQKEASKFTFQNSEYVGVTQPKALLKRGQELTAVDLVEHGGLDIRVTSLERTLVDCFDRLDISGGIEEVWRSFELVPYLRIWQILQYVVLLDNAVTTAKVGFFLDMNKERFHIEKKDLEFLRSHRPAHKSYIYRMERKGKLVRDWNLIVPNDVLQRTWEEPH